jgi:hypothetical protein
MTGAYLAQPRHEIREARIMLHAGPTGRKLVKALLVLLRKRFCVFRWDSLAPFIPGMHVLQNSIIV